MTTPIALVTGATGGREARADTPRSSHATWDPAPARPDPVDLLEDQARGRVPELVPIRYGRMLASPFAFFRGAASVMASDLASTPTSGIQVQLCGDAHLSNFGGFASPDRRLVFDINDFDETLPGPWEWDVKRLAASIVVACRDVGLGRKARRKTVTAAVCAYRTTMRTLAPMRNLDVWYRREEAGSVIAQLRRQARTRMATEVERDSHKARHKDSMRALKRLSESVDGGPRIVAEPPLVVPMRDLLGPEDAAEATGMLREVVRRYNASVRSDVRRILQSYEFVDIAHKVVGVGSVGARAWILLLIGRDAEDPLFLQAKEAQPSVLEPFLPRSAFRNHGRRVVEGQRMLQSASDVMLGWTRAPNIHGIETDYYVRQLWDWKLSPDIESMDHKELGAYGEFCGATLARGHARSGDRVAIAAYLGGGDRFDEAVAEFAESYADQNERDFDSLAAAARSGRIEAQRGV